MSEAAVRRRGPRSRVAFAGAALSLLCIPGCSPPAVPVAGESAIEAIPVPALERGPETYVCQRAGAPPDLDGRLDDPAWVAAAWTSTFVDIEGDARPVPRLRTRAKLLWDDDYLYFGADLEEPDLWATLTERDAVIFHDHDLEVFVDPNGDAHEYYELEINALGTEWDLFLVRPYRDGGPALHGWDIAGLRTAVSLRGTLNDARDRDDGWSVEIAMPWAALAEAAHRDTPPVPGDVWWVNFSRVEWRLERTGDGYAKAIDPDTGRPFPEDNWVWSPQGLINLHYPESWGLVQFSSSLAGTAAEPFAAPVWLEARRRLFRIYYAERARGEVHGGYTSEPAALGIPGIFASSGAAAAELPATLAIAAAGDRFEARYDFDEGGISIREDGRIRWSGGWRREDP